ncbi:YybH family protein [Endozoicomonas sp.]|uniref:YybH family protein n=1 Tax=Endozoicomonas TaxID=305899 RepID=UPI003AF65CD9
MMLINEIFPAVESASRAWRMAFNSGDLIGFSAFYEKNAVLHISPFGSYSGVDEIKAFWQSLIDQDLKVLEYFGIQMTRVAGDQIILRGSWTMNKASGLIHKELWALQDNGYVLMREAELEAVV